MITMQEVKGGGDFVFFRAPGSRSRMLYDYYDYYAGCGEGRWRLYVCCVAEMSSRVGCNYDERGGDVRTFILQYVVSPYLK